MEGVRNGQDLRGAPHLGRGSLRFFALVTLLNLPSEMLPDVLLLDEPELGLHPAAVALVGGMNQVACEGSADHRSDAVTATRRRVRPR